MTKKEMMKMLYSAIAEKNGIEPNSAWDSIEKAIKSTPKDDTEFNAVWSEIVALTNELAENAFTAGFNAAIEITRG